MANMNITPRVVEYLERISKAMGEYTVSVGFMEGATYPDGTGVAEVAFFNEFGVPTKNQPPRPFFRNMIAEEEKTWPEKIARLAKATNYDGKRVMGLMGEDVKGALQKSINDLTTPALSPVTIEKKGFDKPLIETSHMLNSITYAVTQGVDSGDKIK